MNADPCVEVPGASTSRIALAVAIVCALLAVVLRVQLYSETGLQVDDALITYRYAENIAAGSGFVYNPAQWINGTTTPLLTLYVAAAHRLGLAPQLATLGINALACLVAMWACARLVRTSLSTRWALLAAGLICISPSHMVWSISGMETALFTAFISLGMVAYVECRWCLLGIACAGAFLARFDGLILWVALPTSELYLGIWAWRTRPSRTEERTARQQLRRSPDTAGQGWQDRGLPILKTAGVCMLLISPWLVFAALKFHDIVPNSIWAKLALYRGGAFDQTPTADLVLSALRVGFLPAAVELPLLIAGLAVLIVRPSRVVIIPVWFLGFLLFYVLGHTHIHPWYVAPFNTLAIVIAVLGVGRLWQWVIRRVPSGAGSAPAIYSTRTLVVPAVLLVAGLWSIPLAYREAHTRQAIYEHAHAAIGRYLQEHSRPGQVVYAWDIGYIGYLSKREILDFVGIVSPQVMEANRTRQFLRVLQEHQPDWAVIGLYGIAYRQIIDSPWFQETYREAYANKIPGLGALPRDDPRRLLSYRPEYVVYRLRSEAGIAPKPAGHHVKPPQPPRFELRHKASAHACPMIVT